MDEKTRELLKKVAALYQKHHYSLPNDQVLLMITEAPLTVGDLRTAKELLGEEVIRTKPPKFDPGPLPELGEFARSMGKFPKKKGK